MSYTTIIPCAARTVPLQVRNALTVMTLADRQRWLRDHGPMDSLDRDRWPNDSWKLLFALMAVAIALAHLASARAIARPPGVLIQEDPVQTPVDLPSWRHEQYQITPLARYDIHARVLSHEGYRFDAGASLAPIDLAVGWGEMSDSAVLAHFRVTQGARFYTIYPDEQAIDLKLALLHSANMHLVAANENVERVLHRVRSGSLVHLTGYLIEAHRDDGFAWRSSLTREDTGNGACELMWVESAQVQ